LSSQTLFGTDGIRGVAGHSPLTSMETYRLGVCAGRVLASKYPKQKIRIIGVTDTRASGRALFDSLSHGLRSQGVDVYNTGILSTPSVAYLVQAHRFHSGFVISASHNPPAFNGIKFFNSHGRKWADEWEREVESLFRSADSEEALSQEGQELLCANFSSDYEDFLLNTLIKGPLTLTQVFAGLRIAVDCSNGANSLLAPHLFKRLGAQVYVMGNRPNGRNINVRCGSQDVRALRELSLRHRCDAGISFDGDGDRVIMIDEKGGMVDGDHILVVLAKWLKQQKQLRRNSVVVTVMANLGLKQNLRKQGIRLIETPVGDRHVSESMRLHGAVLGGEQSGHIIMGQYLPSGDGLLTALHMLSVMKKSAKRLSVLAGDMKKCPQVLLNVHVREKVALEKLPDVMQKIHHIERELGQGGRVLVRYSGTEPLLRIMLEGPRDAVISHHAQVIAQAVQAHLS
jgi:phosphoglucosamine mutase